MKKMKNVFISSIHQDAGKTMISLGLYKAFKERKYKTAFMKPVGQQYVTVAYGNVDKDSYLIGEIFGCGKKCKDMSPITVGRGYTEKYIFSPQKEKIYKKIEQSFDRVVNRKNAIIIEGTGHAGVGSVIDCSNSDVAAFLGSKVIIVSEGGIGKSIDEIMLNKALFDLNNVDVLGVIVNKVLPEKYDKIKRTVSQGLKNKGLQLLGVIPVEPLLSEPTVEQLMKRIGLKLFCGKGNIHRRVHNTIVAAMEPYNMLSHLQDGTLVITSGDRVDNLLVSVSSHLVSSGAAGTTGKAHSISGLVLTGGLMPDERIVNLLRESKIPVLSSEEDTFSVAAKVTNATVKIQTTDRDKILEAQRLVEKYVNVDGILKKL